MTTNVGPLACTKQHPAELPWQIQLRSSMHVRHHNEGYDYYNPRHVPAILRYVDIDVDAVYWLVSNGTPDEYGYEWRYEFYLEQGDIVGEEHA